MCWSGEASVAMAAVGLCGTIYAARKKQSPLLWIPLFYFTLMEVLQAFTYSVLNQCSLPANQLATFLAYLHIVFQPFFINAVALYFIEERTRLKIQGWVFTLCFIATLVMLIQLYPFDWAGTCDPTRPLCGERLCSVSGTWHLAWEVPTNGLGNYFTRLNVIGFRHGFLAYNLPIMVLPFLYGSWRFALYHLVIGPLLSWMLTPNANERPAVWCIFSVGILLLVIFTPLREALRVKKWGFGTKKLNVD